MMQVVAWFVAGVAWPGVALMGAALWRDVWGAPDVVDRRDVLTLMMSSGVAVAATAVALGVGR